MYDEGYHMVSTVETRQTRSCYSQELRSYDLDGILLADSIA